MFLKAKNRIKEERDLKGTTKNKNDLDDR